VLLSLHTVSSVPQPLLWLTWFFLISALKNWNIMLLFAIIFGLLSHLGAI